MINKDLTEKEALLEDILDALEDGDYQEAEDLADEAIELFPNEGFGYYYLGEALFFQQDMASAVDYYQKAINVAPENFDYKARLGLMYAKLYQEEKAKQIYTSILNSNPTHINSLIALGVYALNDDDLEIALEYLNKAIECSPKNGDAYKIRSIIYTNLNNFPEAITDIDTAIKQNSDDTDLWLQKISLHKKNNDSTAASKAYSEWVDLAPEDPSRHFAYGNYLFSIQDYKSAEKQFTLSIDHEIYGDFAAIDSFLNRGWVRLNQAKNSEAIEDFSKVLALDAKITDAYIGVSQARYKDGDIEAAVTFLDVGLGIVIDKGWILLNKKGAILTEAGKLDQAEMAFRKMLDIDDEEVQAEGFFSMGKLYQKKGDLEKAYEYWKKASDIFHLEADECIEDYCEEFVAKALKEKENELILDMQGDFEANRKSKILNQFFGNYWAADIKTTAAKNKMFAQIPSQMEKKILGLLKNICVAIVNHGIMVLNPGFDGVRMLYSIQKEDSKSVTINGIPLNGTGERTFTLSLVGNHMLLQGIGDKEADIHLYLEKVSSSDKLSKITKNDLIMHAQAGDLEFMGEEFLSTI